MQQKRQHLRAFRTSQFLVPLVLFFSVIAISGCLTAEHKIVHISLNPDGKTGSASIIFSNIMSSPGDATDVSSQDFNSLIVEYYQGKKLETTNPGMRNVRKRLYKQDGKLMGEIDFDFTDLGTLGIYRYKNGPYMYYTIGDGFFSSGQYEYSNGSYLGEKMPVIFWDTTQRTFEYSMQLTTPQEVDKPLIGLYDKWKSEQH